MLRIASACHDQFSDDLSDEYAQSCYNFLAVRELKFVTQMCGQVE